MPPRPRRFLPTIFTTLAALAFMLILPSWLPRPIFGLGTADRPPFSLSVETDRTTLAWYPATRQRAPWAGQVNHLGLRYNVYTYDGGYVSTPTWYLALATILLALLTRLRSHRREPEPGHCAQCGYDIRATPDRCPECGHAAQSASPATPNPANTYVPLGARP